MAKFIRLQVALARMGIASRRGAAEILKAGRVKVDGVVIRQPGHRVNPEKNEITLDNQRSSAQDNSYFILNKPSGVTSTVKDKYAQRTVIDIIGEKGVRVYPVGRLDKDTTGLMLLTNDGPLAYRLTHPKFAVEKVYRVCVEGKIPLSTCKKLAKGVILEEKKTYPCTIRLIAHGNNHSELEIILTEGRKRQIKKMFAFVGHPTFSIQRIKFGPLMLKGLKEGSWREASSEEVKLLKETAGVL